VFVTGRLVTAEFENLKRLFEEQVEHGIARGEISHLSVRSQ